MTNTPLLERAVDGDAQAQFDLGRDYAARQSLTRARRWFREAASRGHAGALCELGLLDLFGFGADPDPAAAVRSLLDAERAGSAEAAYQLGVLGWTGVLQPFDLVQMGARLRAAAQGGHVAARRAIALVYARMGVEGRDFPLPNLAAGATGARTRWSESPLIETIDDVFSAEECALWIELGTPHLTASLGVDDETGTLRRSELRTSSNMTFDSFLEDFALRWLQWRLVGLTDSTLAHAEHTTLLRYLPGEEYRPHRDYLPLARCGDAGQRVNTVFCYLVDVEEGGETDFPQLGVRVAPKRGRAVYFKNLTDEGAPDPRTLHAGLPVVKGEKWLATLWTRERRYRAW